MNENFFKKFGISPLEITLIISISFAICYFFYKGLNQNLYNAYDLKEKRKLSYAITLINSMFEEHDKFINREDLLSSNYLEDHFLTYKENYFWKFEQHNGIAYIEIPMSNNENSVDFHFCNSINQDNVNSLSSCVLKSDFSLDNSYFDPTTYVLKEQDYSNQSIVIFVQV